MGGSGSDEGQSVVVNRTAAFVIAGHTTSNSSLNSLCFSEAEQKGDMKWNKVIAVSTNDYGTIAGPDPRQRIHSLWILG